MSGRINGRTKDIGNNELISMFNKLDYVRIALLFGSRARGSSNRLSDYDFAMVFNLLDNEEWGMKALAYTDICRLLGLDDQDIDIVELDKCDDLIKQSIREKNIYLKGDQDEICRLLD